MTHEVLNKGLRFADLVLWLSKTLILLSRADLSMPVLDKTNNNKGRIEWTPNGMKISRFIGSCGIGL